VTRLLIVPSAFEAARLLPARGVETLVCGVGLLRAGLATAARLARRDVRDALLVGLAGTRDPRLAPVGALVTGTAVRNEAFGAGRAAEFLGLGEMGLSTETLDPELLPLAVPEDPAARIQGGDGTQGTHGVRGILGSVAAASGSPEEAAAWHARHPDVLAEEMETYAVALACARADVPLACVRAISNLAGDRDLRHWDVAGACAALTGALPALLALPTLAPLPAAAP
jgi:futalosine hydrolase